MGFGIGQTVVVAPTYLAEIAPREIRGLCCCMFSGAVYFGIMLGYFTSYGTHEHISNSSSSQWIIPNSLHVIFAGSIFLLTWLSLESPRWLLKTNQTARAEAVLRKLRRLPSTGPYARNELLDITNQLEHERQSSHGTSSFALLRELVSTKPNIYRMCLGIGAQLLGQWSGANSITIYAPEYFAMVGVDASSEALLATGVFGIVKFAAAIACALFLVDFIGRKRALGIGITLQFIAILYIAIYLIVDPSAATSGSRQTPSQRRAGVGAIVMIYVSGIGWAMGWNSIQYLINAEVFPLRYRSIGTSVVMMVHFANQYGNTKAVPEMFLGLGHGGTLVFFSAITLLGLIWVIVFVPELAGMSLEGIEEVFNLPWWSIGLKGAKLVSGRDPVSEELEMREEIEVEVEKKRGVEMEEALEKKRGMEMVEYS